MTPQDLNLHFKYFYTQIFYIHGAIELQKIDMNMLHEDEFNPFLRFFFMLFFCFSIYLFSCMSFCVSLFGLCVCFFFTSINKVNQKNQKLNVNHYALEHHHLIVNYYIIDVIETYKAVILHRFVFIDSLLHPFYFTLKIKYLTRKDQVWYMKTPIGKNTLRLLNKWVIDDLFSLER